MKKNRLIQLLGIQHPIIQGALGFISGPELVAAVSNAGGLGTLSLQFVPKELRKQLQQTKELTDKPFSVNIAVRPGLFGLDKMYELVDIMIEEGAKVATTAAGDPKVLTGRLKAGGIKVMHVAPTVKLAQKAEEAGVDAVIAEGRESGGYVNYEDVATMVLVPLVVDAVEVPVVAAGGICDGRGLAAALALGAYGVQVGTYFAVTPECTAHIRYKEAILKAAEDQTTVVVPPKETGAPPMRSLKNPWALKAHEMMRTGASVEEIKAHIGYPGKVMKGMVSGEVENAGAVMGEIVGMIDKIKPADKMVREIAEGADKILKVLGEMV